MNPITVCSFWVHRPRQYPDAAPYLEMLHILEESCRRVGYAHVVLTDCETAEQVERAGMAPYMAELPESLMRSTTRIQARWLESPYSKGVDSVFVGADCIIRQDFRGKVPRSDLAVAFMKGHKKWRVNNGFMYVPAESRERVAPLLRLIADDTGVAMCEDMIAVERALSPMPQDFGVHRRRGLDVAFLPLAQWNRGYQIDLEDPASDAYVMHFMGDSFTGKPLFFAWAKRWGFAGAVSK